MTLIGDLGTLTPLGFARQLTLPFSLAACCRSVAICLFNPNPVTPALKTNGDGALNDKDARVFRIWRDPTRGQISKPLLHRILAGAFCASSKRRNAAATIASNL